MSLNLLRKLFSRPVTRVAEIEAVKPGTQVGPKAGTQIMLVEVVTTGEKIHVQKSEAVELLISAGQIKPVVKKQWEPPLTLSRWSVPEEYSTGTYVIAWECPGCKQGGRFVGVKPDKVHMLRAWHCGHQGGERVPAEIAARYIVINKPALAPFYEPKQPPPDAPLRPAPDLDSNKISADARVDAQAYQAALKKYNDGIKEEQEARERLRK